MPTTLYIIGNGFDQYHGAQSSYWAFRQYLLRCAPEVVMAFDLYWGPRTLLNSFEHPQHIEQCLLCNPKNYHHSNWTIDHLWADFERYLAELNREKVMTLADWYLPKIDEDDERYFPIPAKRPHQCYPVRLYRHGYAAQAEEIGPSALQAEGVVRSSKDLVYRSESVLENHLVYYLPLHLY